jgi:exopolysaccharide biosynthesis predicted pyruvyltransferase EpsI
MQETVVNFLRRFSDKKISYYACGGNAGDALISASTYTCFEKLKISYDPIFLDSSPRRGVIIFGGGGNFIPLYDYIRKGILKNIASADEIIVLPHTIRGNEDLLASLDKRVTLFCREIASYEHCLRHAKQANVLLANDMAFHADLQALLQEPKDIDYEKKIAKYPNFLEKVINGTTVNFIRKDPERTNHGLHSDMDVSEVFMGSMSDPNAVRKSAAAFLHTISSAKSIITDRLHVGIAASLMNIPCEILDNSYGKNREVYKFSLASKYPKTTFRQTQPPPRFVENKTTDNAVSVRVALAYCVTMQPNLIARMLLTLKAQHEIDRQLGRVCPYDRILITDSGFTDIPSDIVGFFQDFCCNVDAFYFDYLASKKYFSLSQMRNAAFSYATKEGFDWLLLCDCDTIFANYDCEFPSSDYGFPKVYWQKSSDESILKSFETVNNPTSETFSKGNSWFLLSRQIFSSISFNENIYGYGYEDNEFEQRVLAAKFRPVSTDLVIIHKFHPHEERAIEPYINGRNKAIFEHSVSLAKNGKLLEDGKQFGAFHVRHPNWDGFLILYFRQGRLVYLGRGTAGNFKFDGRNLTAEWDELPAETFVFSNGSFVYQQT